MPDGKWHKFSPSKLAVGAPVSVSLYNDSTPICQSFDSFGLFMIECKGLHVACAPLQRRTLAGFVVLAVQMLYDFWRQQIIHKPD